jgi:hypothetical protein
LRNKAKLLKFALLLFFVGSLAATSAKAADTPEQTAKSFYQWYLKAVMRQGARFNKKETLRYVSKRLGKWYLSPAYENYGADYFIDSQDLNEKWQVTTTKALIKGNMTATLKVILAAPKAENSGWTNTLAIKMIKENGAWKIDSVNNRKLLVD